jgi:aldose 1-epimerase
MLLHLTSGDSVVTVCPQIGGSVAQFTWCGQDILRPAPDTAIRDGLVRQMGCYPLVPYSNRIGHGKLVVDRQEFQLRANALPEPHALHGFGWQREWQVAECNSDSATLTLMHHADEDWPFACEVTENIRLSAGALHLSLTLRNLDSRPMPAGLGFHPYFPIDSSTTLQADWDGMWAMGTDMLPTEWLAADAVANFREPRSVADWKVDNCFTGWNRRATLGYATHRVEIEASDNCRQLVCFAPNDERKFIAVEPVTNVNNGFLLETTGVVASGIERLATGAFIEVSTVIRPSNQHKN